MFLVQVVKVADFGVARVKAQTGVMTAETGTYRWMAPEVRSSYQALYMMLGLCFVAPSSVNFTHSETSLTITQLFKV